MRSLRRPTIVLILLVAATAGLAQWFFGNLYEAVVTAPNWRVGFEYQAITGQPQNGGRPMFYYVPLTQLAVVSLWVAALIERRASSQVRRSLGVASLFGLAALLLTGYIVTQLNLRLFLSDELPDLAHIAPLMQQWQLLNAVRLVLVAATLGATANGLRLVYRDQLFSSATTAPSNVVA